MSNLKGGTPGRLLNRLTLDLMLRLTDYARGNYAVSKKDDQDFAKQATEALGFPIEPTNVTTARKALGLPSNFKVNAAANKEKHAAKVAAAKPEGLNLVLDELHALNKQVANLTAAINTLLKAAGQK